jgi:demethylmenaquinone methyltransferase/2-methoxy-6-polyprenyl-1,4-benzoquinol methylase
LAAAAVKLRNFWCNIPWMSQDLTLRHYFCNRHPKNVLSANYVEAFAESMPFPDCLFDRSAQQDCGGLFILVDFHLTNPVFWALLAVFLWLFETETDLGILLAEVGWRADNSEEDRQPKLYAGDNIQVIQVQKSYQIR